MAHKVTTGKHVAFYNIYNRYICVVPSTTFLGHVSSGRAVDYCPSIA